MTMIMTMTILMRVAMPEAAEINPSTMIVETSGEDNILGLVHTMPDKFENATLGAKTEQMFFVHTTAFYQRHNCLISL